jgi:hypothetical protein
VFVSVHWRCDALANQRLERTGMQLRCQVRAAQPPAVRWREESLAFSSTLVGAWCEQLRQERYRESERNR